VATLTTGGKLVMEVRVEPGVGYVPADVHGTKDRINSIPVDAVFTPVRRVAYHIEDTRVGQNTELDRLVLRVWTDGSITPDDALSHAVDILKHQLNVFSDEGTVDLDDAAPMLNLPQREPEEPIQQEHTQLALESLSLSSRVLHSLQEEGIDS